MFVHAAHRRSASGSRDPASDVVTVRSGDSVASLARNMAYDDNQVARFRVLNGLSSNEEVTAGQKVKVVVRGR